MKVKLCRCSHNFENDNQFRNFQMFDRELFPCSPFGGTNFVSVNLLQVFDTYVTMGGMTRKKFLDCMNKNAHKV